MSSHIGDLTALTSLYFGSHAYDPDPPVDILPEKTGEFGTVEEYRESFERMFYGDRHPLASVFEKSPYLLESFEKDNGINLKLDEPAVKTWPSDTQTKQLASYVTELPEEINKLENLRMLLFGYCALTKLPEDMSGLKSLTDVELFCCYDMEEFPMGLATLPKLISLTVSSNFKIPAESTEAGCEALNAGKTAETLQLLHLPNQKMDQLPDLSNMLNLSLLNIQSCGIKGLKGDWAFGKDHAFVTFNASYNSFSSLPENFIGMSAETETINFSHNEFTLLPDIFDAKSVYIMGTVDFSYNRISGLENGAGYHGIRCNILNLSVNNFEKFPKELFPSGSQIGYLQLLGNGMTEIEEDALKGEKLKYLTTIDLSHNKLSKLPDSFNGENMHYLSQIDMSYNRFDAFPYRAVNSQYTLTFVFRGQRDADGNRCMKEWPTGIGASLFRLRGLFLGSNDLGKITDNISHLCYRLDISDNPNISIDLTNICPYIKAGVFDLMYSPNQDIRGCDDALILDK